MKALPGSSLYSNLMLSRRKGWKKELSSFSFIFLWYFLVIISTSLKDYVLVFLYLSDIRSQAWILHCVHTMLTDVGEQRNHDLIHMIILYRIHFPGQLKIQQLK